MHIIVTVIFLCFLFIKGTYRNLNKYGLTVYYVITCNLLYNILCHDHLLWEYKPGVLTTHVLVDLLYTFIILPSVTLLYLSNYPFLQKWLKQARYIMYWVAGSLVISLYFYKTGRLEFNHGYKLWMDALFYPVMYIMLRLHHTRHLLTYILSIIVIVFMMLYFNVPIK
ncbi:CBO0543 family protein [Litchfieldia alkalitelluris]|uniref:CBO0543 family protein n=1 Tax=Litchfieldia alkalitelluris TaxID=304268 RepID=UPI0009968AA7|nr:CBO0543 family protein [Litchfieldia alkalitelluris]